MTLLDVQGIGSGYGDVPVLTDVSSPALPERSISMASRSSGFPRTTW
jgi:hypothetical protein